MTHPTEDERKAFEAWYYDQWSHGETSPVHHAHKKGCEMAWQAQSERIKVLEDALRKIAKMPDLPNPERDADWKNCMKWASHYAREALNQGKVTR